VLGLPAVLHAEEVDPLMVVFFPVAGMPTNSPWWVPV
jgi:hypothetical protein